MATPSRLRRAKDLVLERTAKTRWCLGVGIGRHDAAPALVVQVRKGSRSSARRALARLELDVPVVIREIAAIGARRPARSRAQRPR